ncbi:MAG: GNAT family N-acetyltransferase [Smithella sp.]|nr:GNAT family N-acetyltransferase [Smithella sp.]
MKISIRPCEPHELSFVTEAIDREFILNKGRRSSLKERYPNVLSQQNVKHIQIAVLDRSICGASVIKSFNYVEHSRLWRGAMVGMVWVEPSLRGKYIGKELMGAIKSVLENENYDFGVLWSGKPSFYQQNGWFICDSSIYCEMNCTYGANNAGSVFCRNVNSVDVLQLEEIRSNLEPLRVIRDHSDYQVKPIPANDVDCFLVSSAEGDGYALVGKADECGFLYEIVAPPNLWDSIWMAITKEYETLFINGQAGTPLSNWLSYKHKVTWQRQEKMMWLRISQKAHDISFNSFYIPYFDRI